jgi:hypothetical protein
MAQQFHDDAKVDTLGEQQARAAVLCRPDLAELIARSHRHRRVSSLILLGACSALILLVADLFHPIDRFPVEFLDDRDMRHRGGCRRAVPMLFAGRTPDDIAGPDFLFGFAPALRPAASGGDDQRLPQRMGMPRRARAGFERDQCAIRTRGIGRIEQGIDPYATGKIFGWSLEGTL